MQLVVVSAVRKAVSAATTIFTAISISRWRFMASVHSQWCILRGSWRFLNEFSEFTSNNLSSLILPPPLLPLPFVGGVVGRWCFLNRHRCLHWRDRRREACCHRRCRPQRLPWQRRSSPGQPSSIRGWSPSSARRGCTRR